MSKKSRTNTGHCGVPQCNSYRKNGISMFHLPKEVRDCPLMLEKWSRTLRMGKDFPKQFYICELHFEKNQVLMPLNRVDTKKRAYLVKGAFPTQNLPKSVVASNVINKIRSKRLLAGALSVAERRHACDEELINIEDINYITDENMFEEITTNINEPNQLPQESCITSSNKGTQVNFNPISVNSLCDTDKKLKTLTGIDSHLTLEALVNASYKLRKEDNSYMAMRDKIILTMSKLKTNLSFEELAVLFETTEKTAKYYFVDTIKHLAQILFPLINWQTREQNARQLPKYFQYFQNVRTVLYCTEIKAVTFRCLKCKIGVYSQLIKSPTLKLLIGVSPSGSINYLSKVASGRSSDKAIFNRTDLLNKLEPGDAVMIDKGFMIGDELSKAGIEIVRPEVQSGPFSGQDFRRNKRIVAARVQVEKVIADLQMFKALSEKIPSSIIPYIDYIMTVVCGLLNYGRPCLDDSEFNS